MERLQVVIVDDDPLARERLSRLLSEEDCEIIAVLEDGQSLLDWLAHNKKNIDALFLDIQMPGANGLEILADIPKPPPTIFVTAYSEFAVRAFDLSAIDYLLKPIYPERIKKALEKMVLPELREVEGNVVTHARAWKGHGLRFAHRPCGPPAHALST